VRADLALDFDGTLARVAEIGFREVEFAGYFGRTPAQVRAAVARAGLVAPGAHVPFESLDGDWAAVVGGAAEAGHDWVIVPWIPREERRTIEQWRRLADRFNDAGAAARRLGMRFGYHNHDSEFTPIDGTVPFDALVAGCDPVSVAFELDIYWAVKGGADPIAVLARWPGRFPLIHVKDSAGPPAHVMTDVGAGTIDWPAVFARRAAAGIRHAFVEHDTPADALASLRASYRYLERVDW
jgi:sugar phosphate isomerase/epimerase